MQLDNETLCICRLERAKEDLQAAKINHDSGLFKASINRSYYEHLVLIISQALTGLFVDLSGEREASLHSASRSFR